MTATDTAADTAADIEQRLAQIAGHLNAQHAQLVVLTAQALNGGGWCGFGIHTPAQWLTLQMGISPGHAQQVVAVAERIGEFACLRAVFGRGALSLDQVHVVITNAPAWADARVTELAQVLTVRQLRRVMRAEFFEADPEQPPPEPAQPRDRVSISWDRHSRLNLHANLPADDGAIVEAALNEARDALFQAGNTTVTWPEALVEICQRSLHATSRERRARFTTYLHLAIDQPVQFSNGITLPGSVRDHLLCDGVIQPVWERDHLPIGVGRTQRIVPDRTRRIIEHRDQGCRVPGCTTTRVEIHHIVHWADGGETETSNLISLCRRHHRLHHRGQLHITGNADHHDTLTITDAAGRPLARCRPPNPPDDPPPPGTYQRPSGERLDTRWITFQHPNSLTRHHQLQQQRQQHEREQ